MQIYTPYTKSSLEACETHRNCLRVFVLSILISHTFYVPRNEPQMPVDSFFPSTLSHSHTHIDTHKCDRIGAVAIMLHQVFSMLIRIDM